MSESLLEQDLIKTILNSDASLDILLGRLKQSLNTCEEFLKYIKKRGQIEDEHYAQLRKFAGSSRTSVKAGVAGGTSGKLKNDSFITKFDAIVEFDEKMFNIGSSYVTALNKMYDELISLINTVSKSRKMVKDEGKRKEKDCSDAILAADKAKQKYNHLCDDLEKLKSSDPNKKSFSLTNKTLEQQEDELQRKVDLADQDYKQKVTTCKKLKDEILMIHRPNNSKKLKEMVLELDIAMNVQLQKFATYSENLVMNSGILISPLREEQSSMKSLASSIDNEKDLYNYIRKFEKSSKSQSLVPIEYAIHPLLNRNQKLAKPFLNTNHTNIQAAMSPPTISTPSNYTNGTKAFTAAANASSAAAVATSPPHPHPTGAAPKYSSLDPHSTPELNGPKSLATFSQPTFGVSIEDLIQFAGIDNVPLLVKRCIEVIETHGLYIEGVYRTSGNKTTVHHLKESIDSKFTNYLLIGNNIDPTNVLDADIYCVALLLKIYFASLPEPLLTKEYYQSFIETVKSSDETFIAKKLHHLVFNLPDGAYFTLRALIFHLNTVAANQDNNRMTAKSLSIIWGPALLNDNSMSPQDLSYKSKVVEELMLIAGEIFDTDE